MQFRRNKSAVLRSSTCGRRLPNGSYSRAIFNFLAALMLSAGSVSAATLHYDAFLSGIPIGSAVVKIDLDNTGYRIAGTAASSGVAHLFSDWRSDFVAAGIVQGNAHILTTYAYDEREKEKHRVLWLSDGLVRTVKNEQVRPSHPVRNGTDILTAFFLQGDCWSDRQLHTGRYSYRIIGRRSGQRNLCFFEVREADGDRQRFQVRFGEHEGRLIPIDVRTKGLIRGRVTLRSPPAGEEDSMLLAERP